MQTQETSWTAAEISARLGLSTAIHQKFRLGAEQIAAIRRAGITRIELSLIQGCLDHKDQSQAAEISSACRSEGITVVSVHGPFKLPYGSEDEAIRKTVVEESLVALRFAREMGASVYVAHFGFKEHSKKTADELLRQTEDFDIAIAYHAPQGPLWHFGALPFEQAVSRLRESVRRASSLGAHILTLHLGIAAGEGRTTAIRHGARICRAVASFAEDHGILLCIENVFDEHSVAAAGECAQFFAYADDPRIGLTLDTGHAHICGYLHEIVAAFSNRLVFTHIHDNDLTYDRHLLPGNGTIDWQRLLADLNRACYTDPLNFELREEATLPELIRRWETFFTAPSGHRIHHNCVKTEEKANPR